MMNLKKIAVISAVVVTIVLVLTVMKQDDSFDILNEHNTSLQVKSVDNEDVDIEYIKTPIKKVTKSVPKKEEIENTQTSQETNTTLIRQELKKRAKTLRQEIKATQDQKQREQLRKELQKIRQERRALHKKKKRSSPMFMHAQTEVKKRWLEENPDGDFNALGFKERQELFKAYRQEMKLQKQSK